MGTTASIVPSTETDSIERQTDATNEKTEPVDTDVTINNPVEATSDGMQITVPDDSDNINKNNDDVTNNNDNTNDNNLATSQKSPLGFG